jgi:excisionase family DNA binding protein
MREKDGYRDTIERLSEKYPDKDVLTIAEVCEYLRIDRRTLLAKKDFPAKKIGSAYRIPIVSLALWLA